jgi:hypothetical protein
MGNCVESIKLAIAAHEKRDGRSLSQLKPNHFVFIGESEECLFEGMSCGEELKRVVLCCVVLCVC